MRRRAGARSWTVGPDGVGGNEDDDLRLRASSPGVDAGDNTASGLNGVSTDLYGGIRFGDVSGIPDSGVGTAPIIDMGAGSASGQSFLNRSTRSGLLMKGRPNEIRSASPAAIALSAVSLV